jgi:hypothetical protein
VCIYSQDSGVATLMWSGSVSERAARGYTAAVGAAEQNGDPCQTPTGRWAALKVTGQAGARWDVVDLGCVRIRLAGGRSAPMTPETVSTWAYGGATAYLSAPAAAQDLAPYFTAPSG